MREKPTEELVEAIRHLKTFVRWDDIAAYEINREFHSIRDFIWHLELKYGKLD